MVLLHICTMLTKKGVAENPKKSKLKTIDYEINGSI